MITTKIFAELILIINDYFNGEIEKELKEYEKRNRLTPNSQKKWWSKIK